MTGSVSFTEYRYYVTKFSILCALCAEEEDLFVAEKREKFSSNTLCAVRSIESVTSKGAIGVPLFTTWDSVAGPGRTPMPGNNSGRRQPGNSAVPSTVGRLGVDGFWIRDYGGGSG